MAQSAIEAFSRGDKNISLWDEGRPETQRSTIILVLALQSMRIGRLFIAPLYTDALPETVTERLEKTPGETPIVKARDLHYELQEPVDQDYREMLFAIKSRGDRFTLETREVADILEDALLADKFDPKDLNESLRRDIEKKIKKRFVSCEDLHASAAHKIFDLREKEQADKIKDAQWLDREKVRAEKRLAHGVKKEDAITLYCESGTVSTEIARFFRESGYVNIRALRGGHEGWIAGHFPVAGA